MTISALNYSLLFTATFILVGVLTPLARRFAIKNNIFDVPNTPHKTHKEPVPYLGGVAIIAGVLITSYATAIYKHFDSHDFLLMTSVLAPALILGLIGLWDDLRNLSPAPRFAIQTIAGIFTAWIMIANDTVGNPTGSKVADAIITIIWIVGICNSINFFDNMDGGAAGTVAISSIAIFLIAYDSKQFLITALAAVTIGATTGFLIWNKSPARIYMGDAGALFLGILIATLTIRLKPHTESEFTSLAIPVLLLSIPILDTTVAITSRLRRGVSPFQGGRDHLSHRLIRQGIHRKTSVIILWGLSTLFAAFALLIPQTSKTTEILLTIAAANVWAFLFFRFINTKDK